MEFKYIKNKLSVKAQIFLGSLSEYVETPFYYFGSILRSDYLAGASDVDIDIFTDNEHSTISKLLNYHKLPRTEMKNVVWILNDNTTTYGYKLQYFLDSKNIFEYSIYNSKFKDKILKEHRAKITLPIYTSISLQIIKLLFYKLNVISGYTYTQTKRYLLSYGIGQYHEDKFLVF